MSLTRTQAESYTFVTQAGWPSQDTTAAIDGTNSGARFFSPVGLALGPGNSFYIADGSAIRRISPSGTNWVVTTLAGMANMHASNDGTNVDARFDAPQGLAVDNNGTIYVADTLNNSIRKVALSGTNWIVTTIAGISGSAPGSNDGTNGFASFNQPYGIAIDSGGNLFVADSYNSTIRKVAPSGTNWITTTLAGTAGMPGALNGTNKNARFNGPSSLVVQNATNIYVADFNNHAVRKITSIDTNWVVTTIAGSLGYQGSADGTNSSARFNLPQGIALDSAGNLFVTEFGNSTLRKLKPVGTNWVVSTVAGSPGMPGSSNGTGPAVRFDDPSGVAVDSFGRVSVVDTQNHAVRLGTIAILLELRISSTQIRVSWPSAGSNYFLESSPGLSNPSWPKLTNGILLSGDTYLFTTNVAGPSAFFRLHQP